MGGVNHTTPHKRVARITYQAGGWRWQDDIEPAGALAYSAARESAGDVIISLRAHALRLKAAGVPEFYTHYRLGDSPARKLGVASSRRPDPYRRGLMVGFLCAAIPAALAFFLCLTFP